MVTATEEQSGLPLHGFAAQRQRALFVVPEDAAFGGALYRSAPELADEDGE